MAAAQVDTSASYSSFPETSPGNHTKLNHDDLASRNYIKYYQGIEQVPSDEQQDIDELGELLNQSQKIQWNKHRHCFGATHARTQGIVKGTFVVKDDLPAHLKQTELFSRGGEYPAAARYSTEIGDPGQDDRIPAPRGIALKLFNVKGEKFEANQGTDTQDIEFNSTPVIELADAKTTKEIFQLRIKYRDDPDELAKHIKARKDAELQQGRDQVKNLHLESTRQYSQSAYRFGDYVMKYALVPNTETQHKLFNETVRPEDGPDILHRWLQDFHNQHDAEYLFQVQLLENLDEQSVEYAGTPWDPSKYPWQTVATLKIPKQESFDFDRKAFWEDHIRVDPWLGLKSLQPLGGVNRLRRVVYPKSSALRRKMNGRKEIHVNSIDEIPN